jgi:hypothetical protein
MKIGLWNIDHPETQSGGKKKETRFNNVTEYLIKAECDAYIITEANAAIYLPGYFRYFHLPVRILIQTGGSHFLSSLCPS